eukprot:scaffold151_cov232-Amphora_coffeaeformis.AAC.3
MAKMHHYCRCVASIISVSCAFHGTASFPPSADERDVMGPNCKTRRTNKSAFMGMVWYGMVW